MPQASAAVLSYQSIDTPSPAVFNGNLFITYPSSGSPASGGSYGASGVAPAAVGWNGHAYIAYTGNDSGQHINFLEIF